MAISTDAYIETAERLCATLERIGDALVDLDTATLLETEDTLGRLLAVLASGDVPDGAARLEPVVRRCREALLRCRRLGASHSEIAKVRLPLCTGACYGREGEFGLGRAAGPTMRAVA